MRNFAKIVSLVLIMALFIMILPVPPVYAEDELKEYSIKLVETDMLDQSVSVFLSDGKIMMSITDVARITRCELTQESDVYTLKHAKGFRTIELDARQQTLTENGENWNTYIVEHNGTILVPAYMILTYLGAYCSIDSSNSCLSVYMPLQTFWETLTFTSEQKMNIISYSDTTKNVNVVCDLIIDFMAPISGQSIWSILFKGVDESIAVYAALEADIYKYKSVQASTQTRTQKLNDLAKFFSVGDDIQKTGFDMLFFADDANRLQAYKSIYSLNGRSNQLESYISFQDTIKNRESFKQVYDGAGTKIDASLLLIDIFTTVMDRLQFTDTLKNSLINTFSTKTLKTAGNPLLNDPYLDAAQEVSKTLSSTTNTITNTIFEKATDFVMDKSLTWGLETTVKAFGVAPSATVTTSVGSTALLSVTLGGLAIELIAFLPIGKYTPFGQIPASQADLMAILTSDYYKQTWLVFNGLVEKAEKEEYHNPETMQMLYDSYMILLRFSLVHFESRIKYAESQYIVPSAKSDYQNRADAIAKTIDQLNHCSPAPIPKLSDLEGQSTSFDDAIKSLIIKDSENTQGTEIFAELPDKFIFASGAGAWGTEVQIKPDGTFTGEYHDSNMGDTGTDYPNGTRYECLFSGKFTAVKKINDYEYSMRIEYLNMEGTLGAETISDGVKVITSAPYGFDNADEFLLYLPGRSTADLPVEFLDWVRMPMAWGADVPEVMPFYGLYNVGGKEGFFSEEISQSPASVNATGKSISSGLVAELDDWIYYSNMNDNDYLYKMTATGTEKTMLSSDSSLYINAVDGWVYYTNRSDNDSPYKIRTDGTERTKLNSDDTYNLIVSNGWIYYTSKNDNSSLCRIRTDGTEKTILAEYAYELLLYNERVYYGTDNAEGLLLNTCVIRTDGTEQSDLSIGGTFGMDISDDWIYYSNHADQDYLYKICTDGTGETRLSEESTWSIYVVGEWIYYISKPNYSTQPPVGVDAVWKIKKDGSGKTMICEADAYVIKVVGDWIFFAEYVNDTDPVILTKIHIDGTERQVVT